MIPHLVNVGGGGREEGMVWWHNLHIQNFTAHKNMVDDSYIIIST